MAYIQTMDGLTPSEYADYLRAQQEWANNTLSNASVVFENGKISHDVARSLLAEVNDAKADLDLDFGLYSATGNLLSYKD